MVLYLTPAAIGYLTQLILVLVIAGYFEAYVLARWRTGRPAHMLFLTGFLTATAILILLFFLEAASPPHQRLGIVYLQNTVTGLALLLLLQFSYHFPEFPSGWRWEARLVLALSILYTLFEAGFAIHRFDGLNLGQVSFRPRWADYVLVLGFLWTPVVLLRQAICISRQTSVDTMDLPWLHHLWKPQGHDARAACSLAQVYLFPVGMSLANLLCSYRVIPADVYHASISSGLLLTLFCLAVVYLNFLPEMTTFMVKLVGAALVTLLAVLGLAGWACNPRHIIDRQFASPEGQTLRYTPNAEGGYDVNAVPFHFDHELGMPLDLSDTELETENVALPLDFPFPFYSQIYNQAYVMNDGVIGLGQPVDLRTTQYHYGSSPAIFPLYIDLIPQEAEGGIFARCDDDRLTVTWDRVPAFCDPQAIYTFQLTLFYDGAFEVSYDEMPPTITTQPDGDPEDGVWLIGAVPGRGAAETNQEAHDWVSPQVFEFASVPATGGPQGMVIDFYLAFRRQVHPLLASLTWLIIGSSLVILTAFPLLLHTSLVEPLNALLHGVRRLEAGEYLLELPVRYADEIGFLTRAFNNLAPQLGDLVQNLENRVTARTAQLDAANTQLRAEIAGRRQAQATIIEQQRALAAHDERERLSRELHGGLGQVLGYMQMQAHTTEILLEEKQFQAAQANLAELTRVAERASTDIRHHILDLRALNAVDDARLVVQTPTTRSSAQQSFTLLTALRDCVEVFQTRYKVATTLRLPDSLPEPPLPEAVDEQILHIVQEALTNVGKHAQASCTEVTLDVTYDEVYITISDDGIGFDAVERSNGLADRHLNSEYSASTLHFGLTMMREWVEHLGGRLAVRSAVGQGTQVTVTVPRFQYRVVPADCDFKGVHVLLADDHALFLDGLRNLLLMRGATVVSTACDGIEALEKARALHPDLVAMDLDMPRCNGLEATRAIKAEMPEAKIVILTVSEDENNLFEAIKSGASGYLLKSLDATRFCVLLSGVLRGEAALAPGLAERLLAEFARLGGSQAEDSIEPQEQPLTLRQWQVLRMVAEGLTYKEIGAKLHLSEKTIKYHMGNIVTVLHVRNRSQAIAYLRVHETQYDARED